MVFGVALLIYLLKDTPAGTEVTAGLAGTAILWATNFTMALNFNVTLSTDLEAKLTSLERVIEYADLNPESRRLKDQVGGYSCMAGLLGVWVAAPWWRW